MKKILFIGIVMLLSCGDYLVEDSDPDEDWHSRYVADSCARCPECCSTEANTLAHAADGAVCFEENYSMVESGEYTEDQLTNWCNSPNIEGY